MTGLGHFLAMNGYTRLPLRRSVVGHFHLDGRLNGRAVEVLVDTGAAVTVVALSVVRALGLESTLIDGAAGGAGGALDQYRVDGAVLQLGHLAPRMSGPVGLDFEHINAPLRANGSAEVDLILGADVLDPHAAVIDYASQSLFLRTQPVNGGGD